MVGFRPDLHHGVGGRTVAARSVRGLISKAARALRALIRTARAPLRASSVSRAQRCSRRGAARAAPVGAGPESACSPRCAHMYVEGRAGPESPRRGLRAPPSERTWVMVIVARPSRVWSALYRTAARSRRIEADTGGEPISTGAAADEAIGTAPPPQAGQRPGGRPLTDVGSCRGPTRDTGTYTFLSSGTMPYMAPELWAGRPATVKSDRCALGVLTCEVAPGSTPAMAATSEPCGAGTSRTLRRADSRTAHRARSVAPCSNCSRRTRETSAGRLCRRRCPEFAVAPPRGWHSGRADVPSDPDGGGH